MLEIVKNLVEPNKELANEGLLVGRSVVGKTALIPVRVANVTKESKISGQGKTVANCEDVEVMKDDERWREEEGHARQLTSASSNY